MFDTVKAKISDGYNAVKAKGAAARDGVKAEYTYLKGNKAERATQVAAVFSTLAALYFTPYKGFVAPAVAAAAVVGAELVPDKYVSKETQKKLQTRFIKPMGYTAAAVGGALALKTLASIAAVRPVAMAQVAAGIVPVAVAYKNS